MSRSLRAFSLVVLVATVLAVALAGDAWARAGGGRSFGSAGSRSYSMPRSYSAPARPATPAPSPSTQPSTSPTPYQSQPSPFGGFWRGLAGGVMGGFLGSLLFGGLAHGGGWGGGFGGGFGLLEILLLAGLAYAVFAMVRRSRAQEAPATGYYDRSAAESYTGAATMEPPPAARDDVEAGIRHIQQMDPSFDVRSFTEWATDAFFQIQAAWMHRDLEKLRPLLTEEMQHEFRDMIEQARAAGRINKLENITVRSVEPVEAWQEQGRDYVTVRYLANLLDYTVDEKTGAVVQGDQNTPVKFEEYWTWARNVGPNAWRLTAIQQAG
jgi:predicted lipid-binding transport protein (Tim44 family)